MQKGRKESRVSPDDLGQMADEPSPHKPMHNHATQFQAAGFFTIYILAHVIENIESNTIKSSGLGWLRRKHQAL